jgi:hypothetical protein
MTDRARTRAHRRKRRKEHRGREGHYHEHDGVVDPTLRPAQHEFEAPGLPVRGLGEGGERVREHDGDPPQVETPGRQEAQSERKHRVQGYPGLES